MPLTYTFGGGENASGQVEYAITNFLTIKYARNGFTNLNNSAFGQLVTENLQKITNSIKPMTKLDFESIDSQHSDLYKLNATYWLATASGFHVYEIGVDGKLYLDLATYRGLRPVITLKSDVLFVPTENEINNVPVWNIYGM